MRPANLLVLTAGVCVSLLACSAEDTPNGPSVCPPANPACQQQMLPATAGMGGTAGTTAMQPIMNNPATGMAGSTSVAPTGGTAVPCNVATAVSANCTTCHQKPMKFGATMPLMTLADFHAPAPSNPAKKVFEVLPARLNATIAAQKMPPLPNTITPADQSTISAWATAGAIGDTGPGCAITANPGTVMPMAGSGGTTTGKPSGQGGLSLEPIDYKDPMMKCYEFRAHANGVKGMPYPTPTTPDHYVNFDFMPEWDGTMYARSYRLLLDNEQVVHHWLFFRNNGAKTDLAVSPSSGTHPDGELLHGWAPGGGDLYLDSDVGVEMPSNVAYTLELHYNNRTGGTSPDGTGVEVCVTPTKPAHVAVLSWLGTDNINGTSATGTCDPTATEPIHIIGGTPHMHTKGNHMKVVVNRGGMQEVVHDADFTFDSQVVYPENIMLMPGETITTTCSYSAPATFGPGTTAEMCYWFAMHYPAGSLSNGNIIGSVIHGTNQCLQ